MSETAVVVDAAVEPKKVPEIRYETYKDESQLEAIIKLMEKDLSEPYSIFTYRYFINNWPRLCWLAYDENTIIGAVVCKLEWHKKKSIRGYIAMLAVDSTYRGHGIGSQLVIKAVNEMYDNKCQEAVLETELTNKGALKLYKNLGFIKDKFLPRYYMNGVDAYRLKLLLPPRDRR